ncbi:MAG: methyltransferase domain-containing protein [Lautropia sp.]|nr:methyltransferase domain-containing protein [Lautropia sp.]
MKTPENQRNRDIAAYSAMYEAVSFEPVQAALRKREILRFVRQWQPKHVLEVGCGMDPLFMHYEGFRHFTVVEPSQRFAAHARLLAGQRQGIEIIEDFIEQAVAQHGLASQGYDCILVSSLIHEVADPLSILKAVRACATPRTRIHVNVPNARSVHRLLAFEMGLINDIHAHSARQKSLQQHHTFDSSSLRALVEEAGFVVREEGSYFIKPFTHDQMQQLQQAGILSDAMLDGLMRLEKYMPGLGSEIFVNLGLK